MRKRTLAALTMSVGLFTGLTTATAHASTPATTATCSGWRTTDTWEYEARTVSGKTSPLRSGPYGVCTPVATLPAGARIGIDCYMTNPDYLTVWYYASYSVAGRGVVGWIYEGNVTDVPYVFPCG
ncbi:hypothetical protein [Streptomyces cinerochromogenes]|uniref:hypothetical protein n=1 Tax=Streptomyces cinerochromogenes TaxID=66422 RepID=UPI00339DEDA5